MLTTLLLVPRSYGSMLLLSASGQLQGITQCVECISENACLFSNTNNFKSYVFLIFLSCNMNASLMSQEKVENAGVIRISLLFHKIWSPIMRSSVTSVVEVCGRESTGT